MHFSTIFFLAGLVVVTDAHFQLQFPSPRGVFVEDNEPLFCDGYNTAAPNRTQFPLNSGFFSMNSEHTSWTAGVLVSTAQNPTSFNNFSQVVPFFQMQGEGLFCFPLSLGSSSNVSDGSNVTIQIVFNGGDGTLYQCADLTLSKSASISGVTCSNATNSSSSTSSKGDAVGRASSMVYLAVMLGVASVALTAL